MFSTGSLEMSATPCSIYHMVQSAFGANDLSDLKGCCADLRRKEENRRRIEEYG